MPTYDGTEHFWGIEIMKRKQGIMGDEITEERTLRAMQYNVECKQQFIDSLLSEIVELQEENKRLREEIVYLEHLRATSI